MCNRYRLTHSKSDLAGGFQAFEEIDERPRYNIAPTQPVLTVRREQGQKVRRFTTMRWGLIPSWAKDPSIGVRTLNARSETVMTKAAFRDSILTKRCLIPADGFYEWRRMGSVKQPYCFEVGDGQVFAPNSLVADLHNRMPVIVAQDKYDTWLDPDINDFEAIRDVLRPYDASLMRRYPVSMRLNKSQNDDPESAAAIDLNAPTQEALF